MKTLQDIGSPEYHNFSSALENAFLKLDENKRNVIIKRIGYESEPMTLQKVSSEIGVTRERVRQIEIKAKSILKKDPLWKIAANKMAAVMDKSSTAIEIKDIHKHDEWFDKSFIIPNESWNAIFKSFIDPNLSLIKVNETFFLSPIREDKWEKLVNQGKSLLKSLSDKSLTREDCIKRLEQLWIEKNLNPQTAIFKKYIEVVLEKLFWQKNGEKVILIGFGKSMDDLVYSLLNNARNPMDMNDLIDNVKSIKEFKNENNIRASAQAKGLLYGPSKFGLRKHLKLNEFEIKKVQNVIEDLIVGGEQDRQWHSTELIEKINDNNSTSKPINEYELNIVLSEINTLKYLGRMIWVKTESANKDRLTVRDAVIRILTQHGQPLSNQILRSEVEKLRGTSNNFQIYEGKRIVRIKTGLWALAEWSEQK